jgi:biopolymer transport protein ExbD
MAFSMSGNGSGSGYGSGFGRGRRSGPTALAEINIIPLVDVVLVLLIIFMLTAHVMEFGLEVNVPEVKQVKDTAEELPVVTITRTSKLYLNEKPVTIHQIAPEVRRQFKDAKAVYVLGDTGVPYGQVIQVVSELNEAKLDIKLVAKPEEFINKK